MGVLTEMCLTPLGGTSITITCIFGQRWGIWMRLWQSVCFRFLQSRNRQTDMFWFQFLYCRIPTQGTWSENRNGQKYQNFNRNYISTCQNVWDITGYFVYMWHTADRKKPSVILPLNRYDNYISVWPYYTAVQLGGSTYIMYILPGWRITMIAALYEIYLVKFETCDNIIKILFHSLYLLTLTEHLV